MGNYWLDKCEAEAVRYRLARVYVGIELDDGNLLGCRVMVQGAEELVPLFVVTYQPRKVLADGTEQPCTLEEYAAGIDAGFTC